jgi:hypothetical protein
VTWHSFPKESSCVPLWTNDAQGSLLRHHYPGGRSGSQMFPSQSLLESSQHQQ